MHFEELRYISAEYGAVRMLKLAVQLNDATGALSGWAVMLWPMQIQWAAFQADL